MFRTIKKKLSKNKRQDSKKEIQPDEIFLDSSNLPEYDTDQFEGRIEKPIARKVIMALVLFFLLGMLGYTSRVWFLEVKDGQAYANKSLSNSLRNTLVFASRGVITDRNDTLLAWNEFANGAETDFPYRVYSGLPGLSGVLGYIKYPQKDKSGFYYNTEYDGKDGVEKYFNSTLSGENGLKITETDALGKVQSESVIRPPINGDSVKLSIDAAVQSKFYQIIEAGAQTSGFQGGAGVIMDVHTGEILAMVSYPEYDSQILTDGTNTAAINGYLNNKNNPFLNKVVGGAYTPGSIIKPYMALAALQEHVIDPNKILYTTGSISVPNPYDAAHPSIFKDWQNQGPLDMRKAIQESSDVYFYEIGGGYQDQPGLGINRIEKYIRSFGFGEAFTGIFAGPKGTIPDPAWKAANFNGEAWRIGDTYHTAIGQYGFQVTPLQAVRAVASIANKGELLQPTLIYNDPRASDSLRHNDLIDTSYYQVVQEGMRDGVLKGVATALNVPGVNIAAKTGTAQLGLHNEFVNSWVTGFFPYENPKYAFAVVMEKGPTQYSVNAPAVMGQMMSWMVANAPQYVK
jgi:penicillin-binding protein 2